ncbi:ATP-binding protein [Butyrivibrio sp.]|uniref:ATP-binding protein n=1 Tax=Butyrivibrio sp. TaxID=28121 RepID=UPI0025BCFD2A|nr:ATP-binding protein [Butyrivibrio sp.]MBQ7431331.1 AAA family ATPase [Butyrivibrio sp.]MBQ9302729.1 AAA family ATPase [Butyrivibrio sp.]
MALTNNNLELIKAIAKNDIHMARKAALASLVEDNSKKNAWAVDYYRKMLVGNASILMSNLPSDMQTILVGETPGGFDADRYYVRESEKSVIDDVIKMRLIADEMSKKRISYKNTTLLYGESGTGKTELGRYLAYKLNLPFFYISFVATIDSYMGSTAKNIHKVFDFCSSIPCVLMLDEIDCVAAKRSSSGSKGVDGEIERTTITLQPKIFILYSI